MESVGFSEMLLIGVVALLVVGPKDLPILARKLGGFVKKMRAMAADFQHSFDDLARQAELDELRKEISNLRNLNPINSIKEEVKSAFVAGEDYYKSKPMTAADVQNEEAIIAQKIAAEEAQKRAAEVEPLMVDASDNIEAKPKKPRKPRAKKPKIEAEAATNVEKAS